MSKSETKDLLVTPLTAINIGLDEFARELELQDVPVVNVDWSPPAGGDPKLADLLSKLGT